MNKETLKSILSKVESIAVIGASSNPSRDSNKVIKFLIEKGKVSNAYNAEWLGSQKGRIIVDGKPQNIPLYRRPDIESNKANMTDDQIHSSWDLLK